MARYLDVHPVNPQPRSIAMVAEAIRGGGLVAYPTDSCYALGCRMGNLAALERIRRIRNLDDRHHFTLVCRDFAQLGPLIDVNNATFRLLKANTPGPFTFILPGTKEVPRRLLNPKKHSIGVRIPEHVVAQALLHELDEPIVSSTLLLPGHEEPLTEGWVIKDELDHSVDVVLDGGECGLMPTTVVDLTGDEPEVIRQGAGDASRFL